MNMMIERLRLKAIVMTGKKSVHGELFLRATQLSITSQALCESEDFVRYYEPYLKTPEED